MESLAGVGQGLVAQVLEQPLAALAVTLVVICITTRLVTGGNNSSQTDPTIQGAMIPPAVPYWIPYLGHIPQMAFNADAFFARLKPLYPHGAFSLNFLGGTHSIIFKPGLINSLFAQPKHAVDGDVASKHLVQAVFGYPRSRADSELYDRFLDDMRQQYDHLNTEKSLGQMVRRTADRLRHNVADFVSFNGGEIDQVPWERLAGAALVEEPGGEAVVEADMFELVRNFVAFTAAPAIMGSDFVDNFPQFWQALWRFDKGFMALAMDLPAVLPINKAIGARRARGFLLSWLDEFENAMETTRQGGNPGPKWADLDNVSPLVQHRVDIYRKYNLNVKQRSALDLALIWALSANSNPIIFWVLWRVYSHPDLLARIRDEIADYVVLEKPAVGFGAAFNSATRIESIDPAALLNKCPLLKASYIETLRLDFDGWSFKAVHEDTVVSDKQGNKFFLRAGTYAHAASQLWHMDPAAYEDPEVWRAERHIRWRATDSKGGKEAVAEMGDLKPYGKWRSGLGLAHNIS